MRLPEEDLFHLLHSLSLSEKKEFRSISIRGKKEEPEYLRLFNLITRQKKYNEAALRMHFRKTTTAFAVLKNYLYRHVLEFLEKRRTQLSEEEELQREISFIQVLLDRQLYQQAYKRIQKAMQRSEESEFLLIRMALLELHYRIKNTVERDVEWLRDEGLRHLEKYRQESVKLNEIAEVRKAAMPIVVFANRDRSVKSKGERLALIRTHRSSILGKKQNFKSMRASILYHHYNAIFYQVIGDEEESIRYSESLLQLIDGSGAMRRSFWMDFLVTSFNLLMAKVKTEKQEVMYARIAQLRSSQDWVKREQHQEILQRYWLLMTHVNSYFFKYGLTVKSVSQLEKELDLDLDRKKYIPFKGGTIFNVAMAFFMDKQYRKAIRWVVRITRRKDQPTARFIYIQARVLEVLIHMEMESALKVEAECRSVLRLFEKDNSDFLFEEELVRFIAKHYEGIWSGVEKGKLLKGMNALLLRWQAEFGSKEPFGFFHYKQWLNSRMQKKREEIL